jgi:hypothetical protein
MWKEADMEHLQTLYHHLPGETEENHNKPQTVQQVSGPRFRITNHTNATFSKNERQGEIIEISEVNTMKLFQCVMRKGE